MSWVERHRVDFQALLEGLWPKITSQQVGGIQRALEPFDFEAACSAVRAAFAGEKGHYIPNPAKLKEHITQQQGSKRTHEAECEYCGGVRGFPLQVYVIDPLEAQAKGVPPHFMKDLDLCSSTGKRRTLTLLNLKVAKEVAEAKPREITVYCEHCLQACTVNCVTTKTIRESYASYFEVHPDHHGLRFAVAHAIKCQPTQRTLPVHGEQIADDDEFWDHVLDGAQNEKQLGHMKRLRELLRAGKGVDAVVGKVNE